VFCVYVCLLYVWFFCVLYVPSVLWYCWLGLLTCKNRLPCNLYCFGRDVKHCSIQSNMSVCPCVSIDKTITAIVVCGLEQIVSRQMHWGLRNPESTPKHRLNFARHYSIKNHLHTAQLQQETIKVPYRMDMEAQSPSFYPASAGTDFSSVVGICVL